MAVPIETPQGLVAMTTPPFTDIGKTARDVIRTGYHYGRSLMRFGAKTKNNGNLNVASEYVMNFDERKSSGHAVSSYAIPDYCVLRQKWTKDGTVAAECDVQQRILEGAAITLGVNYNPENSHGAVNVSCSYARNKIHTTCGYTHTFDKICTISGSAVYAWRDVLIGYQGQYDSSKNKMIKNDVALGFGSDDLKLHARWTNIPYELGLSMYYKVNDQWEAALDVISAKNDNANPWTLGIGTKCILQENSIVRFKFNKDLQLGTSLRQQLYEGIALTLSFNADLKNIKSGGHKVGLSLDLEA